MASVIVFGATGAVGRAAAIEAGERGAKVWLAMRDTSKEIKGITREQEESGLFTRVQADLTDPDSVKEAINKSGAKAAFIYAIFGPQSNGLRATCKALKDAGVTWVVLLSSYTIQKDPRDITPDDAIAYFHSTVEISLQDAGMPFAAVRPGYFASNNLSNLEMVKKGEVDLLYPEVTFDHIDPKNIGQVAGAVLTNPENIKPSEPHIIYLMGPELVSQRDAMIQMGQAIGKDVTINEMTEEAWVEKNKKHLPELLVNVLLKNFQQRNQNPNHDSHGLHDEACANITKYSGKQPTKFSEWASATLG